MAEKIGEHPDCYEIEVRVRYCEVDRMGVLHHSRYWPFLEMARIELLRVCGSDYGRVEDGGVFLVVSKCSACYLAPAYYDDVLTIKVRVAKMGKARIDHKYEVVRKADDVLIATAETTIACIDGDGRIIGLPDYIRGTA